MGGGSNALPEFPVWLPVAELGRGRDKTQDPETGSRQGGEQRLESWRMFGEEDAAVGARAAS